MAGTCIRSWPVRQARTRRNKTVILFIPCLENVSPDDDEAGAQPWTAGAGRRWGRARDARPARRAGPGRSTGTRAGARRRGLAGDPRAAVGAGAGAGAHGAGAGRLRWAPRRRRGGGTRTGPG